MKSPIIVEFNGLPGLGKTTVATSLVEALKQSGSKTMGNYRHSLFHTLHHPFPELYSPALYRLVKSYADTIPPKGKKRTHVHWTNYYAQKYESILKHNVADFVIIDEGIIQFMVAMAFQDRMPESDKVEAVVKKLQSMGIFFVRVDCVNDVVTSAARIMSRPPRGLVFVSMQHDELLRTLETEASNFEFLRSVFSKVYSNQLVININTVQTSPLENANTIMNKLKDL